MDFEQFKEKYQRKEVREYPHKVTPTPLVSVMVQTFQHKKFIKDCLDSILNQETDFPFEILLGEDFSSDGTRELCIAYAEKYPEKIRLFLHHPENKIKILGVITGNFNSLYNFYSAKGKYIAFCEGDDIWKDPLKLKKQVDFLEINPDFSFCFHSFYEVIEQEHTISREDVLEQPQTDISAEDLRHLRSHPLLSTVCFKNSLEGKLPEELAEIINMDSLLISSLGKWGQAGFLINITPSLYRRHSNGIWSGTAKEFKFQSKMLTYKKLTKLYHQKGQYDLEIHFQKCTRELKKSLVYFYLKNGNIRKGCRELLKLR